MLAETEVFNDFCQICHCCFTQPYSLDLVFGVAVIGYTVPKLVTVPISSLSTKSYSPVLITLVFFRFNLIHALSLSVFDPMHQFNHLPCFSLVEWYMRNTGLVCSTILQFASLSSNCVVLIMHLLYRWNWPWNKIQCCLTSFWIQNHFVCLVQPVLWLLALYIGLQLAPLNVQVLSYCSCSSTSLIALHYQKHFSDLWNIATHFFYVTLPSP